MRDSHEQPIVQHLVRQDALRQVVRQVYGKHIDSPPPPLKRKATRS